MQPHFYITIINYAAINGKAESKALQVTCPTSWNVLQVTHPSDPNCIPIASDINFHEIPFRQAQGVSGWKSSTREDSGVTLSNSTQGPQKREKTKQKSAPPIPRK